MDSNLLNEINTIPRPSFMVNPQNAQEGDNGIPPASQDDPRIQGMQRIGGVLVPAEIARERTKPVSKDRCPACKRNGSIRSSRNREGLLQVTMCEVRQHSTLADCWITCSGYVYNATTFMKEDEHPGGERAFIRRAGGVVDCAEDFAFHSVRGRRMWSKYRIGIIVSCDDPGESESGGCVIS